MKKITVKVITISSQLLVVILFLFLVLIKEGSNSGLLTVGNNNLEKMADSTSILFENEETVDVGNENVVIVLDDNTQSEVKEENQETGYDNVTKLDNVIETYTGILTGYGPDCAGCGNFNTGKVSTASGYHVSNIVDGAIEPAFTITYNDEEYGEVRIVAADANIPFYSIVRITVPHWESPVTAIVLDRGSTVGFENCRSERGCLTQFDLLYPTEAESLGKTRNVTFELLRSGR